MQNILKMGKLILKQQLKFDIPLKKNGKKIEELSLKRFI